MKKYLSLLLFLLMGCSPPGTDLPSNPSVASVCNGINDLANIPSAYLTAMNKYITTNGSYLVNVCTEDTNDDGTANFMVVESTNQPEHRSVYFDANNVFYETYDFLTNIYKYAAVYTGQPAQSAGNNKIQAQNIILKMPIAPAQATTKTATTFATIGLALNGVSFFNENAAPGDQITNELFTFDQCSGHPQEHGVYHYHVDPICLIRDLGGNVINRSTVANATTYNWIEDDGTNAGLLIGFLMDGFPVYGPIGNGGEIDCNGTTVVTAIDTYNGHSHCTTELTSPTYHYHAKTASVGGPGSPVFWITNQFYYGTPGSVSF